MMMISMEMMQDSRLLMIHRKHHRNLDDGDGDGDGDDIDDYGDNGDDDGENGDDEE